MPQPDVDPPIGIDSVPNRFGQRDGIYGDLGCIECRQRDLRIELRLPLRG